MCLDILKNPPSALIKAKKQKNVSKTWVALLESCLMIGVASGILIAKSGSFSQLALTFGLTSVFTVLVTVFVLTLVLSYLLKVIALNLGGKGDYHEALTAMSFMLVPISASILVASVFALVPVGIIVSVIISAIGFASGFSTLYRGVKELFGLGIVESMITVSVLVISIFAALYVTAGLAALTQLTAMLPVIA